MTTPSDDRLESLERKVRELDDKDAIRSVLYRYCRAADRCDESLMLSCYHEDAVDDHGFYSGPAQLFVSHVIAELRKLVLSVHSLANVTIQLDGDSAEVETYYTVVHRLKHCSGFTDFYHHGRYLDDFESRNGEWRILRRVIVQDGECWFQTADLSPFLSSSPNYPLQGSNQGKGDPVYRIGNIESLVRVRPTVANLWDGFRKIAISPLFVVRVLSIVFRLRNKQRQPRKENTGWRNRWR